MLVFKNKYCTRKHHFLPEHDILMDPHRQSTSRRLSGSESVASHLARDSRWDVAQRRPASGATGEVRSPGSVG